MSATPDFSDWLAITALKAAYCRLLDTKAWDDWGLLFTEDFRLDVSDSGGGILEGRAAVVESVRRSIDSASTVHQVHSPEIAIDGDEATGIWAMQDRVVWPGGRALTGWGHYHETYRRTAEGWRIAVQRLTRLRMEFDDDK